MTTQRSRSRNAEAKAEAKAEAEAAEQKPADAGTSTTSTPESTTLDDDTTKPSTTAPGDGAADTTDPHERATSTPPNPGEEAKRAGTVNAVTPVPAAPKPSGRSKGPKHRVERYPQTKPDGTQVTIEHNIDTGETKVIDGD
jgi:hypothetical protein